MDENELRLAAIETLLIELLALADAPIIERLEASIREGLPAKGEPGFGGDEHTIRSQALQLIADGKMRHELFTPFGKVRD